MAQTPKFNPTMDPISFNPKPVVSGVKDKGSTMSMLAGLGSLTAEGIANYQRTSVFEDYEKQLGVLGDTYLQGTPSPTPEQEQEMLNIAGAAQEDKLFLDNMTFNPTYETGEQIEADYSRVEASYNQKIDMLNKALQQSKLTAKEFNNRAMALTRETVAANPHLSRELLSNLSNYLTISGVREQIDLETQQAQAQAEIYNKRLTRAEASVEELSKVFPEISRENLVDQNGNLILEVAEQAVSQGYQKIAMATQAEKALETAKNASELEVQELWNSGFVTQVLDTKQAIIQSDMAKIFLENPANFAAANVNARIYLQNEISKIQSNPGFSRLVQKPEFRAVFDGFIKRQEVILEALQDFNSGEDVKKYLNNSRLILEDQQMIALLDKVNVSAVKIGLDIANTLNIQDPSVLNLRSEVAKSILTLLDPNLKGAGLNQNTITKLPNGNLSPAGAAVNSVIKNKDPEQAEVVVSNLSNGIDSPTNDLTENAKFYALDEFVKITSSKDGMEAMQDWTPETRTHYENMTLAYNEAIENDLYTFSNKYPDDAINLTINGFTGKLVATSTNKQAVAEFNKVYASRIDNAIKSYANYNGISLKEAASTFYSQYYGNILSASPTESLVNNPITIIDPKTNQPYKYDTEEQGWQAAEAKVLSLYNGEIDPENPNAKAVKPRRTVRDLVSALRPSSSVRAETGVSNEKFASIIASNLGVKPTDKLNLEDRQQMANFLAAYSNASGNTVIPMRVHDFLHGEDETNPVTEVDYEEANNLIKREAFAIWRDKEAFNQLSAEEQEAVANIIDPPLESAMAPWEILGALRLVGPTSKLLSRIGIKLPNMFLKKVGRSGTGFKQWRAAENAATQAAKKSPTGPNVNVKPFDKSKVKDLDKINKERLDALKRGQEKITPAPVQKPPALTQAKPAQPTARATKPVRTQPKNKS